MPTGLTLGQLRSEVQNATGQSSLVLTTAELNQLINFGLEEIQYCLLYTSPSPRD